MPSHPFRFAIQSFSAPSASAWRDIARRAEDLGYSTLHLADHFLGPGSAIETTNHPIQELAAVPAMAVAAEVTSTLRVGCRVFCIDYRNPVVLAKEAATLDLLSEGRLELGLGAGWLQNEYAAVDLPFDRPGLRIERLAEVVAAIKAFMTGKPLDVEGDHVHWSGFEGVPRPVQQPHPPIMIGGGGKRVLSLAAREADVVSLNFNNQSGVLGADGIQSGTVEATAEKIGWIRDAAGERFDRLELEIGAYFTFVTEGAAAIAEGMGKAFGLTGEQMVHHPHALMGTVDAIVEELQERRERTGISYVTVPGEQAEAFAPIVAKLAGS